ncbi:Retrovirus-related Pol polyprotein from transposon TNT 1-94 [Vitis vinifera]|uniref:Retrovirus-related Pol polyprotein from transposon TNT 1-94 n=1 Tax=Vitis vinifera TaxID=29760 RepID=A0A438DSL6_VITVI|nr:Retrovirus-related Pol polyprotein from transposon TNT 1-94 [Vitis vinifera]
MAAESSNFVQPAIPKFDGHYDHCRSTKVPQESKGHNFKPLRREFEVLQMKEGESVDEYFARTLTIANKMKIHGESMKQVVIIEKILRSMTSRFDYVVCSVEESNDLDTLTIDELQSSLLVHEQRMNGHGRDEQALKVTYDDKFAEKEVVVVELFEKEARKGQTSIQQSYKLDEKEEMLLMSYVELNQSRKEDVFLDSGCSNHMCGNKLWFSNLDEEFRQSVKLGNNSKMTVLGKGNIRMQLLELLRVYHPEKGLIMQTSSLQIGCSYCPYGHLSFKGLRTLQYKEMVRGLPQLKASSKVCTDCMVGKQHRDAIPKRSLWRASQRLQLVHADICGPIKPVSNDRGGEFTSLEFNAFCKTNGISRQLTAAYTPQQNGVAERKNRTIMNMVRSMLSEKQVSKNFWPKAVNWIAHITREKKLDDKSFQCVLLGVSEESKAYRLYDLVSKKIVVSRDVVFEEDKCWNWGRSNEEVRDLMCLNGEIAMKKGVKMNRSIWRKLTKLTTREEQKSTILDGRFVSGGEFSEGDVEHNLVLFTSTADPTTFEEAVQSSKWRVAMDLEIEAIERNGTWEQTDLPEGVKKIGVKWVFKTKLNENGKVDKCKARLVAKGYAQQHGIDYTEVFAPVARWDTIRMVIALAARNGWSVYQLDVKSAFLHGELNEAVFIEQPQGYEKKNEEHKVYKLKKALYGLKQAPRAWYSRIEAYFIKEGFERCSCDHTLFIKTGDGGKILIVSLYVDDLIFTGNDESMFVKFKNSMKLEFDMTDLGKMKYFLGVEVLQNSEGIYISQRKYAKEVLERFGMEKSNSVKNPIVPGDRLTKNKAELRFMASPTEMHLQAAKRVLRYLNGTVDLGVFYQKEGNGELMAYTDSDYAGDVDDKKKFVATASCSCQGVWMRKVLEKLGHSQGKCTTVLCDNSSTIKLSKNLVMHGRSKHIDVRFHFLRDLTRDGAVELKHCGTQEQVADIMTKLLKLDVFLKLRELLGVSVVPRVN